MKKLLFCLLACACVLTATAGDNAENAENAKKKGLHKFKNYNGADYLIFGIGPNYMFGDPGGSYTMNMMANDWDVLYTRPSLLAGYKHDFGDYVGTRVQFMYNLFSGNDENSRHERAFQYYTHALEVSWQWEYFFYRGKYKKRNFDVFFFAGMAGMVYDNYMRYYEPKSGLIRRDGNGDPVPGREYAHLGDIIPDDFEYNKDKQMFQRSGATLAVPFGFGVRFFYKQGWIISTEAGWRYAFGSEDSDYIDGLKTSWSDYNDTYFNLNVVVAYRFAGGDNCYSKFGRKQFRFISW